MTRTDKKTAKTMRKLVCTLPLLVSSMTCGTMLLSQPAWAASAGNIMGSSVFAAPKAVAETTVKEAPVTEATKAPAETAKAPVEATKAPAEEAKAPAETQAPAKTAPASPNMALGSTKVFVGFADKSSSEATVPLSKKAKSSLLGLGFFFLMILLVLFIRMYMKNDPKQQEANAK